MFRILLYPFFITTLLCFLINGEEFSECNNKPSGSFIPVSNNCSKAIYCDGADSTIVDCDFNNPYFSPSDEMCYDNARVCEDRPFKEGIISSTTKLSIPTTSSSVTTSLVGIITTKAPTSISVGPLAASTSNTTTAKPITNVISTAQPSSTNSAITIAATIVPTPNIITTVSSSSTRPTIITTPTTTTTTDLAISLPCPAIDYSYKPLFFPHPKSCSQYYLCYHGAAIVMQCPNMLYFDMSQQNCNTADRVICQVKSDIPRELCLPHTVDLYPHSSNCNYYYLCEYGFLMVMQCPFNMAWDYEKRVCVMRSNAKCYKAVLSY